MKLVSNQSHTSFRDFVCGKKYIGDGLYAQTYRLGGRILGKIMEVGRRSNNVHIKVYYFICACSSVGRALDF